MEDSNSNSLLHRTHALLTFAGVLLAFLVNAIAAYKLSDLFLKTIIFFAFSNIVLCAILEINNRKKLEFSLVHDISHTPILETAPQTKRYISFISIILRVFAILSIFVILYSAVFF
jgi:hypothetical protein